MKGIKLIMLFILSVNAAFPQADSVLVKKANTRNLKRLGANALRQNDPASAITFLEAYQKTGKKDAQAMELLGRAYMLARDYDRAERAFLIAYSTNRSKAPEALYFHAQMQKSTGRYDSAGINFQKFKKEYKGSDKHLKKQAAREIAFCDSVKKLSKMENKIIVQHLDTSINKINTEASPANLNDSTLLFTSLRTEKKEYVYEDDTAATKKKKLYYAKRRNNEWTFEGEFGNGINDQGFNISNACFSQDRKRIYFTRCRQNMKEAMICAIYVSEQKENGWSQPVRLPKSVNHPKYSSTMPAVGTDPVKGNDVIYFVSNKKSGKGGNDIWYTVSNKKTGIFRVPKNAGSKINTPQNEMSPFFDNETRSLYFSSDCAGGLGGFDIYKATGDGKRWTSVENIGKPVNTGADDIYYTISTNRKEGFFVSNRKGGNSLKNATCCDDIYYYIRSEYAMVLLSGTIREMVEPHHLVPEATMEVYIKDKNTGDKFLVKTFLSDSFGNYQITLEGGHDYFLQVKKEDYLGTIEKVTTTSNPEKLTQDLRLVKRPKEPIRIPNIQYEFDKSEILESSQLNIDTTVLVLMINNPELIIEIQSHTDSKGSEAYNRRLSQKRAESVVGYLKSKGIASERLRAKGYGESKPVVPNENPDGSDNPENRAVNRRTDFKIIGVVNQEIINAGSEND